MNVDPKLDYMPKTFMDYMMNQVLYSNMKRMQTMAVAMNDTSNENYQYYERKIPYYEWCQEIMFDQTKMINGRVDV